MQCHDFHELADSYLGDELLVETNHGVLQHLEACPDCRGELAARRALRAQLRAAFAHAPELQPGPAFVSRLHAQLRAEALGTTSAFRWNSWMAVAASLLLIATIGLLTTQFRPIKTTEIVAVNRETGSNNTLPHNETIETTASAPPPTHAPDGTVDAPAQFLSAGFQAAAAGVHRDCAVSFKLPARPISLAEAGRLYDRAYSGLTSAVNLRGVPLSARARIVEAHSCVFGGRRFAHVVLRDHEHLISVLVTDLDGAPAAAAGEAVPDGARQAVVDQAATEGYQVAYFTTSKHAVFVVSDLAAERNNEVARALVPSVSRHLRRAESATA